ncbi:YbaB/EbfC family nucleoid-associated protein [Mariniblastus sp.]|nr:YbaB/EbfC family nucleoid-associated protein [Mariniblastus sp.]
MNEFRALRGGGMVTVHASGHGQVLSIEFDAVLTEKADMDMVKDLLPAAINDALTKSAEMKAEMMQGVAGDLPIPGDIGDMMKQFMGGGGES